MYCLDRQKVCTKISFDNLTLLAYRIIDFKIMETQPSTELNIYQKLLIIQQKVTGLSKDKKAFNYDYVTGDKLLSFVKPLMNELGLLLKQEVLSIDNVRQDYVLVNKDRTEKAKSEILSKVMMRFTWINCDTGEKDENLFGANGQNDWDKGCGSAFTYGERYFLLKYFHIATDKDDIDNPDRNENSGGESKPAAKPEVKQPEKKTLSIDELADWKLKIDEIASPVGLTGFYNSLNPELQADQGMQGLLKSRREELKK